MVAETRVNPTESREKINDALTTLFSGRVQFQGGPDDYGSARLDGNGRGSLESFRMILQRDRIRAAARAQLFRGLEENKIVVFLNKQVAHAGHVSFSAPEGESPLGPIRLTIESDDCVGLIEWLTGGRETERLARARKCSADRRLLVFFWLAASILVVPL